MLETGRQRCAEGHAGETGCFSENRSPRASVPHQALPYEPARAVKQIPINHPRRRIAGSLLGKLSA
jgi:hypothetical protein